MNKKKILIGIIILIPLIALIGFTMWAYTPLGPMPEALDAMQSISDVNVDTSDWIMFSPLGDIPKTGLIFYPGGRVDPRSYAPIAMDIAQRGYLVVIVPMPFNLAVFGAGEASRIIETYPDINHWVIAGHSLGGSMAARYSLQNPEQIKGLVLWAAYPAAGDDLTNYDIDSASIFGSNDGLVGEQDIQNAREQLPSGNFFQMIEGGNHAQFGWYGDQPGDYPAEISRQEQQEMIVETTLQILGN